MSATTDMVTAALVVAGWGWPVFLLGRSKRPLANCPQCPAGDEPGGHDPQSCACLTCHGFYAATCDPGRIRQMIAHQPSGLLAVRCGRAPAGAGVVVIDIDCPKGGRLDLGLMAPTLLVASGNHGWHLYYRHPGRPVLSRPLPGRAGIDVKADGGYVVLPPSVHPITGRAYRWANHRDIQEMPPRLAGLVSTPAAAPAGALVPARWRPGHHRAAGTDQVRHPERFVQVCLDRVRDAPEGRRRVTLYGAARGVARAIHAGYPAALAVDQLTTTGQQAGQTDRDIHAAITAAFTAEGLTHP